MDYNIVADQLELIDPTPDIWELFRQFDTQFFEETLTRNCVELSWSPRMTQTAGLCAWNPKTQFCSIRLSLPLLQLRSRRDLIETLLHEMIHGFLFVTREDDNHESHGEKFHYHMYRINQMTGTRISVYHTFHDEVRNYQTHIWKCDGPCQNWRPFYGIVKRAMNRCPGPNDTWWKRHEETCGGKYHKVAEPDPKTKPKALARPVPIPSSAKKRVEPCSDGGDVASSSKGHSSSKMPKNQSASMSSATKLVGGSSGSSSNNGTCDPSQKKISDYWSKIGPGRRLCD